MDEINPCEFGGLHFRSDTVSETVQICLLWSAVMRIKGLGQGFFQLSCFQIPQAPCSDCLGIVQLLNRSRGDFGAHIFFWSTETSFYSAIVNGTVRHHCVSPAEQLFIPRAKDWWVSATNLHMPASEIFECLHFPRWQSHPSSAAPHQAEKMLRSHTTHHYCPGVK